MSVTNVLEEIMQLISKSNWNIASKMTPSDIFTANGQCRNRTLKRLKERGQTTSKEKGINSANVCVLLFLKYDVRIKYGKLV